MTAAGRTGTRAFAATRDPGAARRRPTLRAGRASSPTSGAGAARVGGSRTTRVRVARRRLRLRLRHGRAIGTGGSGRQSIGVERDPDHLREAARRYPWLTVLEGDAAALPFADGASTRSSCSTSLEHVPDPRAVARRGRRVLRPGGVLVLSVPHRGLLAPARLAERLPGAAPPLPSWQPLEPADETGPAGAPPLHDRGARELLGPRFAIDRIARTGLGLASWSTSGCSSRSRVCCDWRARLPRAAAGALPRVPRRRPRARPVRSATT